MANNYDKRKDRIISTILFIVVSFFSFNVIIEKGKSLTKEDLFAGKPISITKYLTKEITYQFINGELLEKEVIEQ
jgi:hypothetical protein